MLPEIISAKIIPFPWTDHCAVSINIASTLPRSHDTTWCMKDFMLTHPSLNKEIEKSISDYFKDNDTNDISALTLWEAHKPVIRGRMIQLATKFKRERKIMFSKLETNFNNCHQTFQSCPMTINNSNLEKARLDLDLFLTESADKSLRNRQHTFYLNANKPDTPLARSLKTIQYEKKPSI